jgi:DNA-directed RNA polymerase specialized sigma24 family protein
LAGHPGAAAQPGTGDRLHYYEDYSISQIAAALGRAPGTIKAQLHQGRRRLARLLGTGPDRGRPT